MKTSGKAFIYDSRQASVSEACCFSDACCKLRDILTSKAGDNAVFRAHLEILDDPMIAEGVEAGVAEGMSELESLETTCSQICEMFAGIDDEYLRARVDDVRDVCSQLGAYMSGRVRDRMELPDSCILVAEELLPSDTSDIDFSKVLGIVCHRGSSTSHVCIISRSKGVPINVGRDISGISDGDTVEVDDPLVGESPEEKIRSLGKELYCNASSVEDIRRAIAAGADGIGLFRTEFLFLHRDTMPGLEEQTEIYRDAILACAGKILTLRTIDIGGDKKIPWLELPAEDNPFLGLRGIRLCLKYPDILKTQMQAIVDAALMVRAEHPEYFMEGKTPVRVMFPMVDTVEEIREARSIVDIPEGLISFGIMVETPAAVFSFNKLASECEFISFGTNDLTQYVMAADRGNSEVAYLYQPLAEPVLRAIGMVTTAAESAGIHTGICGEAASDPRAVEALAALGIGSFSVNNI